MVDKQRPVHWPSAVRYPVQNPLPCHSALSGPSPGFQHHPIQVAAHLLMQSFRIGPSMFRHRRRRLTQAADPYAQSRRFLLANDPPLLVEAGLPQVGILEGVVPVSNSYSNTPSA